MADKEKEKAPSAVKVVARVRPPGPNELASDIIVHCDNTGTNVVVDVCCTDACIVFS